jgi:DNA-binding response OmpR family regulator
MTGTMVFDNAIIRAADEGVPIQAIKRIFKMLVDTVNIRELLATAVRAGRLIGLPREDWPPKVATDARTPQHKVAECDDDEMVFNISRQMKFTRLESRIFLVLIRRGQASREQLHDAVEANRGYPDETTQEKIVDVVVCKLRKKLAPHGLILSTVHGQGYEMADAHREKAWQLIKGEPTCQQEQSSTTPAS